MYDNVLEYVNVMPNNNPQYLQRTQSIKTRSFKSHLRVLRLSKSNIIYTLICTNNFAVHVYKHKIILIYVHVIYIICRYLLYIYNINHHIL